MEISQELNEMLAREAIRNCIARLARGEDRRDAALIGSTYWSDAMIDFGVFLGTYDEYLAWVVPGDPGLPCTLHMLAQTHIELKGETALAETLVLSYHRVDPGGAHQDTVIGGRYLDTMEKRATSGGNSEWRIAKRIMLYDFYQDWGPAIDWTQGVMGMQFSHEHFSGRGHGDYSEVFFGKRQG